MTRGFLLPAAILSAVLFAVPATAAVFGTEADATVAQARETPLRLGVAGVSHGHIANITDNLDKGIFELVGVYEADAGYREDNPLRRKADASIFYDELGRMLDETRPEAVVCFGSIKDHLATVRECAPRHIHVMVEKPLGASLRDAREMVSLASRYGILLLTNYETSWYPSNAFVKSLVDEGRLGRLVRMNVFDGHSGPVEIGCAPRFTDWLTDPVLNGGGAVIDFGCYGANLATWLLGNERPVSVTAVLHTAKPGVYPKVDDDATILLDYASGVTVQIMGSWCWPYNRKDMFVYGLEGYVYQKDATHLDVLAKNHAGKYDSVTAPALPSPSDNPFAYLRAAVRGEITVAPTDLASMENNLIVNEILDAALRSARSGRIVRLR